MVKDRKVLLTFSKKVKKCRWWAKFRKICPLKILKCGLQWKYLKGPLRVKIQKTAIHIEIVVLVFFRKILSTVLLFGKKWNILSSNFFKNYFFSNWLFQIWTRPKWKYARLNELQGRIFFTQDIKKVC